MIILLWILYFFVEVLLCLALFMEFKNPPKFTFWMCMEFIVNVLFFIALK